MTKTDDKGGRKSLSLNKPLDMKSGLGDSSQVQQKFAHGRSNTVTVEVKKKRGATPTPAAAAPSASTPQQPAKTVAKPKKPFSTQKTPGSKPPRSSQKNRGDRKDPNLLTRNEMAARAAALQGARNQAIQQQAVDAENRVRKAEEDKLLAEQAAAEAKVAAKVAKEEERVANRRSPEERRKAEEEEARRLTEEAEATKSAQAAVHREKKKSAPTEEPARAPRQTQTEQRTPGARTAPKEAGADDTRSSTTRKKPLKTARAPTAPTDNRQNQGQKKGGDQRRQSGRLTIGNALNDRGPRQRSLAAVKRARKRQQMQPADVQKVFREVTIPEVISVQELANRMSERSVDVIKSLMKLGIMATAAQTIDADTAELVVEELGHTAKRIAESDVEIGLGGEIIDTEDSLLPRAPVVAVMGHVDHGKTSLLDALRKTDIVSGEAGGITQHIGAYQVNLESGELITFLDTPGHEAFTAMRMRGATVTDIVILVVAADDSVMPQTIEAIKHSKAAQVPVIVAINKCDKPDANPDKVRQELLQHEIFVEDLGGEVQAVEVSAVTGKGLDKLQEAILLQAEILELKANPNRSAQGSVVEAKIETGRGMVATVLVKRGTLNVGDNFVAGPAYGKVRALLDYRGKPTEMAGPSVPVEVLGIQGSPIAGDDFVVTETEGQAKEIAEYRQRVAKDKKVTASARGTIEQMFLAIQEGTASELPIVIKADVQGSSEAIVSSLENLGTDEVKVNILLAGVGGITESDISLAMASGAMVIAFNTRANTQARDEAEAQGIDIRYYSVIYNVIDDIKGLLSGMLAPTLREDFLGYAQIREVFNITKLGNIGGCMVTEGVVKRGSKVRLLRDNIVIHEGTLSTLKRFKDEVKEVKSGMECGMAFESYYDLKENDQIECFEVVEIARHL